MKFRLFVMAILVIATFGSVACGDHPINNFTNPTNPVVTYAETNTLSAGAREFALMNAAQVGGVVVRWATGKQVRVYFASQVPVTANTRKLVLDNANWLASSESGVSYVEGGTPADNDVAVVQEEDGINGCASAQLDRVVNGEIKHVVIRVQFGLSCAKDEEGTMLGSIVHELSCHGDGFGLTHPAGQTFGWNICNSIAPSNSTDGYTISDTGSYREYRRFLDTNSIGSTVR